MNLKNKLSLVYLNTLKQKSKVFGKVNLTSNQDDKIKILFAVELYYQQLHKNFIEFLKKDIDTLTHRELELMSIDFNLLALQTRLTPAAVIKEANKVHKEDAEHFLDACKQGLNEKAKNSKAIKNLLDEAIKKNTKEK